MPYSTRISSGFGVVSVNNRSGIHLENREDNIGYAPYRLDNFTRTITSTVTMSLGAAGVSTISGSSASPITVVMPHPSSSIGSFFTFRSLSVHAHVISGSTTMFANNTSTGGQLALSSSVGASVSLHSDGNMWLVLGNNGTVTIS